MLSIGPHGAYSSRRTIRKENLDDYTRILFRNKPTLVKREVLEQLAAEADTRVDDRRPIDAEVPKELRQAGVDTEEFFIRDDYKGGGPRFRRGRGKGRNPPVSLDIRVSFTGTRRERNQAFERLEQMFLERMPFLARRGGLIGREPSDRRAIERVVVSRSELNGRQNRGLGRVIKFDLEAV